MSLGLVNQGANLRFPAHCTVGRAHYFTKPSLKNPTLEDDSPEESLTHHDLLDLLVGGLPQDGDGGDLGDRDDPGQQEEERGHAVQHGGVSEVPWGEIKVQY